MTGMFGEVINYVRGTELNGKFYSKRFVKDSFFPSALIQRLKIHPIVKQMMNVIIMTVSLRFG